MNIGLKEAKDMVDNLPLSLKSEISKEDSEKIKELFESLGGIIEIK